MDGGTPSAGSGVNGLADLTIDVVRKMVPGAKRSSIENNLPLVLNALTEVDLTTTDFGLMAVATINAETGIFEPLNEGVSKYNTTNLKDGPFFDKYNNRKDLGNGPTDGATFKGRGFIQITGRKNYTSYSAALGLGTTLVDDPEKANDPQIAARILARYLKDREDAFVKAFAARDFREARRLVNGGANGLTEFETSFRLGRRLLAEAGRFGGFPALRLFIRPPFSGTPDQTWTLVHGFGADPGVSSPVFQGEAVFRTTGTGQVFAAAEGVLSALPPFWLPVDARDGVHDVVDAVAPESVMLYLCISPRVLSNASFDARAGGIGTLLAFAYRHLDPGSLESALGRQLDGLGLGDTITRARAVELLLAGELSVPVKAGDLIAQAAVVPSGAPPAATTREVGFAALTGRGPFDPSYAYDWMRGFVEDAQPDVDAFLALSPARWPIIDPALPRGDALALTALNTYPWTVLEQLRTERELTRAEWRAVGDSQKRLYRERLLARAGRAAVTSTEPPFEFNDRDVHNLFQLEALVEFYANFDDPWSAQAQPVAPDAPAYQRIDFLGPAGEAALVDGLTLTLDGAPDLSQVRPSDSSDAHADLIHLDGDTARPGGTYRITSVEGNRVTVDSSPSVTGPTAWQIRLRTIIVLVDPFGPRERSGDRLAGGAAFVEGPGTVLLNGRARLERINCARRAGPNPPPGNWESGAFDTIYFPADAAPSRPGRPARTYRILAVDPDNRRLTLDGTPVFPEDASPWHVPAGVSGEVGALQYALGPNQPTPRATAQTSSKGTDHYDGVVFLVSNNQIGRITRASSFTSRRPDAGDEGLSSIRGNRRYHVVSFRSTSDFKNYAFKVEDPGADDTVAEARFYFGEHVTGDQNGKNLIRIHQGTQNGVGSGSLGCLVSPLFPDLRSFVIERQLDEWRALRPRVPLPRYAILRNVTHERGAAIWKNTNTKEPNPAIGVLAGGDWTGRIHCTLWLVRPDERPEG